MESNEKSFAIELLNIMLELFLNDKYCIEWNKMLIAVWKIFSRVLTCHVCPSLRVLTCECSEVQHTVRDFICEILPLRRIQLPRPLGQLSLPL